MKTEKPWGHEILFAKTTAYAGKVIYVKSGHRLSLQYHRKKEETMYIQQGECSISFGEEERKLSSGDSIHIPPLTRHRVHALTDVIIFEVSTPELDDVVRLSDDYGRTS